MIETIHMTISGLSAVVSGPYGTYDVSYRDRDAFFEDLNSKLKFGWEMISSSSDSFTLSRHLPKKGTLVFKNG